MDKLKVLQLISNYSPIEEPEKTFKDQIINFIENNPDFVSKSNTCGHLTASAWIVNHDKSRVLLIHHKKLDKWLQTGGHIENDLDLLAAAHREAQEETGLKSIRAGYPDIYDIDIHIIPSNKNEKEHLHYDIRFLFIADSNETLKISNESKDLKWFSVENLESFIGEPSMLRMLKKFL
jgi:8-oxo-dGTP pyrophosphatase MutT (NUDIX family)